MTTEIERLRELEAKATKGPWGLSESLTGVVVSNDRSIIASFSHPREHDGGSGPCGTVFGEQIEGNRQLSVASRNALPRLLALYDAAKALHEDMSERFDLDSPSTNPGIKDTMEQVRIALSALSSPQ